MTTEEEKSSKASGGENVLLPPTRVSDHFEVSCLRCPSILLKELQHVFSHVQQAPKSTPVTAIVTCQRSDLDLVKYGDDVDEEKDRLLEIFMDFAKEVCNDLVSQGHWADYIDPCSGLAMFDPNPNRAYSEVDGVQTLLKYKVMNAGCCKVLLHPQWGSSIYPASMFTTAPDNIVLSVLKAKINNA